LNKQKKKTTIKSRIAFIDKRIEKIRTNFNKKFTQRKGE